MLFRKNIYKKEKGRKVGHEMFYLSIPLNIAWTNLRIRRLLISVDTCFYTFTTIAIVSLPKRIFCADKRRSRICGLQMNMVYLESDCYGLFIKKMSLIVLNLRIFVIYIDPNRNQSFIYLIAANNIKQAYLNMAFR